MKNIKNVSDQIGLSAAQRELFAYLLEEEGVETPQLQTICPRKNPDELPLSFAQKRLWFLEQLEPGNPFYNIPATVHLSGLLNVVALEQSLNAIVERHDVLRTNFPLVNGSPVQSIASTLSVNLPVIDLQALPDVEQSLEVQRLASKEAQAPFDLSRDALLRGTLLQLGKAEYVLLLTVHHIVSDGWSMGVLIREMTVFYEAFSTGNPTPLTQLPELSIQYADFAHWQQQWLQGDVLDAQLNYWKQQLAGVPPLLELPTDSPRSATQTFCGARQSLVLPQPLTESLTVLSHEQGSPSS